MKLRTKLTVFSILLIVAAITACCIVILSFAQRSEMQDIVETGIADYNHFYSSVGQLIPYDAPSSASIKRIYLRNAFRSVDGFRAFTLRQSGEYISNNVGFDVEAQFRNDLSSPSSGDLNIQYKTVRVNGSDYFIAHAVIPIGGEAYDLSLARDISETTNQIRTLAVKCILTSLGITLAAAFVMWLIVHQSMKPVQKLKTGASELAQGHYENRIALTGKDELAELASDFNSMADAIEANIGELHEKSERQQAFINDLSHELKTPITSILLCSETLLGRKVSQETLNRSLERIYNQGKWMETLSQKLMTLTMLQGEITLQPESVMELLEAVNETTADALREKNMELILDCTMNALPMDFDLLRSALVNLVENARKASNDGQPIEIHAHGNSIEVIDHGKGIPPEEIARVTEPFYMVDRSRNKKLGGTGLGLALVKRIAEAHGAALSIDSVLGHGTTMRLTFQAPE